MSSFTIEATCRNCGGELDYIAGPPSKLRQNSELACVTMCQNCHHYWVLRVEMLRAPADAAAAERARKSRYVHEARTCGAGDPRRKVAS